MPRRRFKPEEIVAKLRQVDVLVSQGQNMADAIRQIGVSEVTFYRWRQEFGGLKSDQVKRLRDLELENSRLRKAVSDLTLDKPGVRSRRSPIPEKRLWLGGGGGVIAEFQHSHPDVRVTLQMGTADQAIELLRSHRAELSFVAGTIAAPEIETEPLFEYDVVIVGKPALVPRRPSRDSLEKVTWISREEGSATRTSGAMLGASCVRLGVTCTVLCF